MSRPRLATVWLSGCSGCHMSILNLHDALQELLQRCELVYSPLADIKEYPHDVDCVLVEGAVANRENRELARIIRQRSKVVISLGDCAINGNVSALRNPKGLNAALGCAYDDTSPATGLAALEHKVLPLHQVITVDGFINGCPPQAEQIAAALQRLLAST